MYAFACVYFFHLIFILFKIIKKLSKPMIHFQILVGATVFANLYFYIKYKNKRLPNTPFLLKAQRENVQEESSEVIVRCIYSLRVSTDGIV